MNRVSFITTDYAKLPSTDELARAVDDLDYPAPSEDDLTWILFGKAPGQVTWADIKRLDDGNTNSSQPPGASEPTPH